MKKLLSTTSICIFFLIVSLSCQQRIEPDFEKTIIKINNQQIEIITAWKIFDEYVATKSDYPKDIFLRIKKEFNQDVEYPFLLDALKNEIKPDDELRKEIESMKIIDFVVLLILPIN